MNESCSSELSARLAAIAAANPAKDLEKNFRGMLVERLRAPGARDARGIRRAGRRCSRARARSSPRSRRASPSSRPASASAAERGSRHPQRDRTSSWDVAVVYSRGLAGLDAPLVRVEAHVGGGLPQFHIVGLPETEVKEARDRVRAALATARFEFPAGRITVNLAPADLPKESGRFDLPIAIGILAATGQVPTNALAGLEFAGELALSGELRADPRRARDDVRRASRRARFRAARNPSRARRRSPRRATILPARTLLEVCAHLTGEHAARAIQRRAQAVREPAYPDLADVRGQAQARRALEIAAAGGHSLLLRGPPGTGKTMLAQRFAGILPPMSEDEALEAAARAEPRERALPRPSASAQRAVPRAAPHRLGDRAGRRRLAAAPGRDLARAPRRAVPRRAARVRPPRARGAARAARVGRASRSRAPRARRISPRASSSSPR